MKTRKERGDKAQPRGRGIASRPAGGGRTRSGNAGLWWRTRWPILRFVLLYALFLGLFYLLTITAIMRDSVFPAYLRWNAVVSAKILSLTERNITTQDKTLYGRTSLTIERGCDAIEPSALFVAGVLAFPAAWRRRIPGLLIGTICLMLLNLVRIVSLYYARLWTPTWFDFLHVQVWQAAFIFLAILFWILWAIWAIRMTRSANHVPAASH